MKRIERVYREVLYQAIEKKQNFLTQKNLSKECMISIGNVYHALKPLESMNAIEKKPRGFKVINTKKILLYWASIRNLQKDIVYQTYSNKPTVEIEKMMPTCLFTAYSGYKFIFNSAPSDYSEVLLYANKEEVERRFPKTKNKPNIFVLKTDEHLMKFKQVPLAQLFVDLWNLSTWYAQDFLKVLEEKIDGILERYNNR
jgi:DNA-binding transcriptional MocR family regulator